MSFQIQCPNCQAEFEVEEELIGQQGECECGATFEIPVLEVEEDVVIETSSGEESVEKQCPFCNKMVDFNATKCIFCEKPISAFTATAQTECRQSVDGDRVPCPHCGEIIKEKAKKCKFCKTILDDSFIQKRSPNLANNATNDAYEQKNKVIKNDAHVKSKSPLKYIIGASVVVVVLIAVGAVLLIAVGGFLLYGKKSNESSTANTIAKKAEQPAKKQSDKWESEYRAILIDLASSASVHLQAGEYEKAEAKYDILWNLLENRTVKDETLRIIIDEAKNKSKQRIHLSQKRNIETAMQEARKCSMNVNSLEKSIIKLDEAIFQNSDAPNTDQAEKQLKTTRLMLNTVRRQISGECYIRLKNNTKMIRTPSIFLVKKNDANTRMFNEFRTFSKQYFNAKLIVDNEIVHIRRGDTGKLMDARVAMLNIPGKTLKMMSALQKPSIALGLRSPSPDTGMFAFNNVPSGQYLLVAFCDIFTQNIWWIVTVSKKDGTPTIIDLSNKNALVTDRN